MSRPLLDSPHERLQWAREQAGFADKADFARAVNMNPTTYRAYEAGQNGFAKHAPTFARKLGVTAEWLLDGGPIPRITRLEQPDHAPIIKSEEGSIPLRHLDLSLSMGNGTTLEDYYEEGVFEFDAALLRRISRAPAHRLVVGQGVGDSMQPTLHSEDMVIFDTTQTTLNAMDKIWAISIYGQGAVKRLRKVSNDSVLVISDNPGIDNHEYPIEDLRILGRVIWSARRH